VIYVAVTGNLFDVTENQRYRLCTDPLYVVLLGLLLQDPRLRRMGARLRELSGGISKARHVRLSSA